MPSVPVVVRLDLVLSAERDEEAERLVAWLNAPSWPREQLKAEVGREFARRLLSLYARERRTVGDA